MMDDDKGWWEVFSASVETLPGVNPVIEDLWALKRAVEPEMRGPFVVAPDGEQVTAFEWDIAFPSGVCYSQPVAKVLLHPIMRNVYHIRNLEEATGLTAVIRRGYVELVKFCE